MATDHVMRLGKIIGNLQSLETMLRMFLDRVFTSTSPRLPAGKTYFGLQPGEQVPENAFTNFDTLGQLVAKFNAVVAQRDQGLTIDESVVALRDLLAHGRIAADSPDEARLTILKFAKPERGTVRVTECAMMTDQWCDERNDLVHAQIEKIARALETLTV